MGPAIYSFVFAAIMSANAVTTNNVVVAIVDWLACLWLFVSGCILTFQHYNEIKPVTLDDEN